VYSRGQQHGTQHARAQWKMTSANMRPFFAHGCTISSDREDTRACACAVSCVFQASAFAVLVAACHNKAKQWNGQTAYVRACVASHMHTCKKKKHAMTHTASACCAPHSHYVAFPLIDSKLPLPAQHYFATDGTAMRLLQKECRGPIPWSGTSQIRLADSLGGSLSTFSAGSSLRAAVDNTIIEIVTGMLS